MVSNEAQATIPPHKPFDETKELGQVNVLYSFIENRYVKKVSSRVDHESSKGTFDVNAVSPLRSNDETLI